MPSGGFPSLTSRKFVRALHRLGFETIRQTGSHATLRHVDGINVVVPYHGSRDFHRGFAKRLLKQAEVPVADFLAAP